MRTDAVQMPAIDKKIEAKKIIRFMTVIVKKSFLCEGTKATNYLHPNGFQFLSLGLALGPVFQNKSKKARQ
jgi:uncharacterized alpha-E superfamily protein